MRELGATAARWLHGRIAERSTHPGGRPAQLWHTSPGGSDIMSRHQRVAAVVATAAVLTLAAGCGRDSGGGTETAKPVDTGKASGEITVWAMGTEGEKLAAFAKDFTTDLYAVLILALLVVVGRTSCGLWSWPPPTNTRFRSRLALFSIGQSRTDFGLLLAGAVVVILPVLNVFLVLQRHFMRGIATTGLK
jgi:hypothetical protein